MKLKQFRRQVFQSPWVLTLSFQTLLINKVWNRKSVTTCMLNTMSKMMNCKELATSISATSHAFSRILELNGGIYLGQSSTPPLGFRAETKNGIVALLVLNRHATPEL